MRNGAPQRMASLDASLSSSRLAASETSVVDEFITPRPGRTRAVALLYPELLLNTAAMCSVASPALMPTHAHSYVIRRLHAATAATTSFAACPLPLSPQ